MKTNYCLSKAGLVSALLIALTGCTTYVMQRPEPQAGYVPQPQPQSVPVYVQQPASPQPSPAPTVVVIQREDDFYQPLSPYGEWVVVGSYGRCWRPSQVETGWRPYSNGHWELTDDGWYWASDEPWAWATYHYGRWELAGNYGWIWVPQTQWAPAWVSWREGGGYVGWAPLPPEPRGGVSVNVTIAPAAFCFVEEARMHEPVRSKTVIVNNTIIINKTVNITKTKVVNKVVVNEGPRADEVEHVSGRKIQKVSVNDLRHKEEEPVVEKHRNLQPARPEVHEQPVQKQPEPRKENRAQDLQNRQNGNPQTSPVLQPIPRETQKPLRKENEQQEQAKPERAIPPAVKNHQDEAVKEAHPPIPPTPKEVRPVEKPVDQTPPIIKNKDRQPVKQKPEVQSPRQSEQKRSMTRSDKQQKNEPAADKGRNVPKANDRGREAGGTNAVDNANQRERR